MAVRSHLLTVKMDLHNVQYVSYRVPVDPLRPLVPSELTLAAEKDRVNLSIVAMQCRKVYLLNLEWPSFNYDQLNLRPDVVGEIIRLKFKIGSCNSRHRQT